MLTERELQSVFLAAEGVGLEDVEIYSEWSFQAQVRLQGRTDELRMNLKQGTSLRAKKAGVPTTLLIAGNTAEEILKALTNTPRTNPSNAGATSAALHSLETTPPKELTEAASKCLGLLRTAFHTQNAVHFAFAEADLRLRNYLVCRQGEPVRTGTETSGEVRADWKVGDIALPAELEEKTWMRSRAEIRGLLDEVACSTQGLQAQVRKSLTPAVRWPAPSADLPILWSARCIGQIQVLFLQAFEADRVLGDRSFLTGLSLPLEVAFSLEDRPPQDTFDHEGQPRKAACIFRQGKPALLACNQRVARQLEVSPTGHARRESYEAHPTIGFWHPHLEPSQNQPNLLEAMQWGLYVREIEVGNYDPLCTEINLTLVESFLIHHGEPGEMVEPITLKLTLVELLESFKGFEDASVTTGVAVGKQNQRWVVDISAPRALSHSLPIPGRVPASHYWQV